MKNKNNSRKSSSRRSLHGVFRTHGLPTGDICDVLDARGEGGDEISEWAARVIRYLRRDRHEMSGMRQISH
jgi:hypothetical protein